MTSLPPDVTALYDRYLAAVNAESATSRVAALRECAVPEFRLTSFAPYQVQGLHAIAAKLGELAAVPTGNRLRLRRRGAVDAVIDTFRVAFEGVDDTGAVRLTGTHVGTVAAGRLTSITAFADARPEAPAFANVRGRRVVITGGSRGIGAATVLTLATAGARVVTCGRDATALARVADAAAASGAEVTSHVVDVTDFGDLDAFLDAAERTLGTVDILVNNAGETALRDFLGTDECAWEQCLRVNLLAVVRATRRLLPGMIAQRWGRIVMVASSGAKYPTAPWIDYAAAKAAVAATGKALAREYGSANVLVNTVLPGLIRTDMTERSLCQIADGSDESAEDLAAAWATTVPLGRWGRPEEVAAFIRFLCSPDADYISGAAVDLDGGQATHVY
jgi:NAD(P)-dependent dehydrogenase (short-subunit alcohol dehydrogenase family)